jgi:hypothetical protein
MDLSREIASIPPPPRCVRRRRGYLTLIGECIFLIPLGMFVFIYLKISVGTIRLLWFSERVPATVTQAELEPGGRGGRTWHLTLAYQFAGADYTHAIHTGVRAGESFKAGDRVHVQLLPEQADRGGLYDPDYPARFVTVVMCAIGILPLMVPFRAIWHFGVVPWRVRRLLREGTPTAGVIVDKTQVRGRPPTYQVTYEYRAPPAPEGGQVWATPVALRGSMSVSHGDYAAVEIGDAVAVIYHAERPQRAVVPQFTDYQLLPDGSP